MHSEEIFLDPLDLIFFDFPNQHLEDHQVAYLFVPGGYHVAGVIGKDKPRSISFECSSPIKDEIDAALAWKEFMKKLPDDQFRLFFGETAILYKCFGGFMDWASYKGGNP